MNTPISLQLRKDEMINISTGEELEFDSFDSCNWKIH